MTKARLFAILVILALPVWLRADQTWTLASSTLTYHISHPLHEADGVSHAARGQGICTGGTCNFLIAVPVKTFDSGNSNRDLHMLEVMRGGQYPLVVVRFRLPAAELQQPVIRADLEVQLAGQTAEYKQVAFHRADQGKDIRVTGTIPLKLSDFKIKPPSLLAIPIRNDVPVRVDTVWRLQS